MNSKVSIVKCDSYNRELVCAKVKEAIGLLGGITAFVRPASRVLVKPNLLMGLGPESGVNTHPEVVRAVIRVLKEIGCRIIIGDGPSVFGRHSGDVDNVYERAGIKRISEEEGVELVKFEKKRWREKFPLAAWLDNCDCLVNVPKFKTHELMVLTGAIKNLYGLVWGTHKAELHKHNFYVQDFAKVLVDIYSEARPSLTVIDGITTMEGDGPATGGKLRQDNLLLAGADCVALDAVLAKIMGLEPLDISSTKEAAGRRLGIADIPAIEINGEPLENVIGRPFILPSSSFKRKLPEPVIAFARSLIKFYPSVERKNCISCAACIQACPNKVISMKAKGIVFDYAKCISCFCCQEFCPASAIKIRKNWFMKLVGL
jgi:uncharacterized protein (DUF362 family)/ferredoxin